MSYKVRILLILIFIISTGFQNFGFGFYWFSIPFPFMKITEGLLIFGFLTIYAILIKDRVRWFEPILLPITLLLFFTVLQIFINSFRDDLVIGEILQKIPLFICLFFVFPLMYQIRTLDSLLIIIKGIVFFGFIAAILSILQLFFPNLIVEKLIEYDDVLRVDNPAILLSTYAIFFTYSSIISKTYVFNKPITYIIFVISIVAVFLTYARGFIFGTLLCFPIILFFYNSNKIGKERIRPIVYSFFAIISVMLLLNSLDYNIDTFIKRTTEGLDQYYSDNAEGSVGIRKEMTNAKITGILNESPLTGIGFKFINYKKLNLDQEEFQKYYVDPHALNGDSTLPNIFIIFGILGVILFIWLIISLFINSKKVYKYSNDNISRLLALSIMPAPFFIVVHSFASSYISSAGFTFIVLIIFILYNLKHTQNHISIQ